MPKEAFVDDVKALELVNAELVAQGHAPVVMHENQRRAAYASLQMYAHQTGRPLEVAIKDVVRFQIQGEEIERLRA